MIYAIQAMQNRSLPDGSTRIHQVPTFYLDSAAQGIVSVEHAETIARDILNSFPDPTVETHVSAYAVHGEFAA